jgi:Protein of unknown function (DUF642)
MALRRLGATSAIVCTLVLALSMPPAFAAGNLLGNSGFEAPRVPASSPAEFPTGSTLGTCGLAMPGSPGFQTGCWRVFAGNVDIFGNGIWDAKAGRQSMELNGSGPGYVLQLYLAQPNRVYKLKFSLAGDPFVAGTVSLLAVQEQFDANGAYIIGAEIGSYGFDTTGHTPTSMGYQTETGFFTTGATAQYVDVELQSTTDDTSNPWWGPVVDQVTVTDHGPAPQRPH